MRRVDYINQEPVMCFPTPVLDFNIIKNNEVKFSNGDFVNFGEKSRVPLSTYFYKYKENLLIVDNDREKPICHIIKNSKVNKTINIEDLKREDFSMMDQVIDIKGNELKINDYDDIYIFCKEFIDTKKAKQDAHKETRLKLQELIDSSDRMRKLDKVAGTEKVIDFISEENFKEIKNKLSFIYNNKQDDLEIYKRKLKEFKNLNSFIVITNTLDNLFYEEFKIKNKEHATLLSIANEKATILTKEFNQKWIKKEQYSAEKKLGSLFDCYNEMFCEKKHPKEQLDFIEDLIVNQIQNNEDLLDSFIEWVDLCPIDKEELRELFNEMILNRANKTEINSL